MEVEATKDKRGGREGPSRMVYEAATVDFLYQDLRLHSRGGAGVETHSEIGGIRNCKVGGEATGYIAAGETVIVCPAVSGGTAPPVPAGSHWRRCEINADLLGPFPGTHGTRMTASTTVAPKPSSAQRPAPTASPLCTESGRLNSPWCAVVGRAQGPLSADLCHGGADWLATPAPIAARPPFALELPRHCRRSLASVHSTSRPHPCRLYPKYLTLLMSLGPRTLCRFWGGGESGSIV
jgi:hypothetical protein